MLGYQLARPRQPDLTTVGDMRRHPPASPSATRPPNKHCSARIYPLIFRMKDVPEELAVQAGG